jgi:hypothetical protein
VFKLSKITEWTISHQQLLYLPLMCMARLAWTYQSLMFWFKQDRIARSEPEVLIELGALTIHWVWYLGTAAMFVKPVMFFWYLALSQAFGGMLLAACFSLNHVSLFYS